MCVQSQDKSCNIAHDHLTLVSLVELQATNHSGKVTAWCRTARYVQSHFNMQWPPTNGRYKPPRTWHWYMERRWSCNLQLITWLVPCHGPLQRSIVVHSHSQMVTEFLSIWRKA